MKGEINQLKSIKKHWAGKVEAGNVMGHHLGKYTEHQHCQWALQRGEGWDCTSTNWQSALNCSGYYSS